jgi:PAS domain S-box-containing protein
MAYKLYHKYVVAMVLILALSLSILSYKSFKQQQKQWIENKFTEAVQQQVLTTRHSLQQHTGILNAYAAFFGLQLLTERKLAQQYATNLAGEHYPGLLDIYWVAKIDEKYIVKFGLYDSDFLPLNSDLSQDELWQQLKFARTTGEVRASAPQRLIRDYRLDEFIVFFVKPVYANGQVLDTPSQRHQHLQGFVIGVFNIQKLLASSLQNNGRSLIYMRLKIQDEQQPKYVYQDAGMPVHIGPNDLYTSTNFAIATGQQWEMQAVLNPARMPIYSAWLELTLFLGGIFLTLLIIWAFLQYYRSQQNALSNINTLEQQVNDSTTALRASHQRLKTILNNLESQVCVVDMQNFEILFANKFLKKMRGIEELEGKICWHNFFPQQTEPCDFCTNAKLLDNEGKPSGLYTWEFFNPYNKQWYLMQDSAIQWTDGRIVRLEIATDITSRKQSEMLLRESEQYRRALIEASTTGLVLIDSKTGIFVEVNTAFARSLGYQISDIVDKLSFWDLTPPEHHPITNQQYTMLSQTGRFGPYEKAYLHKDGYHVAVRLSGLLMKHKGKNLIWANVEDISYQKRAQEAEAAKLIAEQANRAKSMCLTHLSHELRTPLNAILSYTDLLSQSPNLDSDQIEKLGIIQHSSHYLLNLVEDILDLSKVEAGKLELNFTQVDLVKFNHSIIDLFRAKAIQQEINLIYFPLESGPYIVYTDEKRLRQILINLISNAIKFTPKHGSVTISLQAVSTNNIRFEITDTGQGIAKEDLNNIFEPFQQVGERKYHAEGSGLGLAITKNLVNLLNGKLEVHSVLGQGSSFAVTIPMPEIQTDKPTIIDDKTITNLSTLGRIGYDYPLSSEQIQQFYDVSMKGDIKGILAFANKLRSNTETANFGLYLYQAAKQLQLEHIYQIALYYKDKIEPSSSGHDSE